MTDNITIRKAITEYAQNTDTPQIETIIVDVADELSVPHARVRVKLDSMRKNGIVYIVNGQVKVLCVKKNRR